MKKEWGVFGMRRKQHKVWAGVALTFVLFCLVGIYVVSEQESTVKQVLAAEEDSSETTTESVSDMREGLENIRKNHESAQQLLTDLQVLKNDVVEYLGELDKKVAALEDDLVNMAQLQDGIEDNLFRVRKELAVDKQTEENQYAAMKLRIRYLYEHGNYSFMDALAGSASFGDMLNRSTLASMIQKYDNDLLEQYRNSLTAIAEKEEYISGRQEELARVTAALEEERGIANQLIEDKSEELKLYNNNIASAGNLIKFYEEEEKRQEEEIAAAESAYADDEMYASLPSDYTGGKFLWPAPGHYQITSKFGYRIHPLTGTRRLHAGIDIAVPTGCGIYAGADGVVAVATYSSSAGNYVLINHGGGFSTVYMHNSKLLVSVGQQVKRGQKIALSGSTGWSTGPHCHFGVRKSGKYVNPIPYLKSTSSSDESDYSESDIPDTDSDAISDTSSEDSEDAPIKREDSEDPAYTTEADDVGDNKDKSSDLKDDSDPDSE